MSILFPPFITYAIVIWQRYGDIFVLGVNYCGFDNDFDDGYPANDAECDYSDCHRDSCETTMQERDSEDNNIQLKNY